MNKNEETIYAKVFNANDYKDVTLNSLEFFPCDYIIRCVDGPYEGRQVRLKDLDDEIVIGSDESCNFYIKDAEISGRHCKLSYIPNSIYYTLKDLNSKTGTWLKLNSFEDGLEIKEKTYFKLFHHVFEIYHKDGNHYLNFLEGSKKGNWRKLDEECNLSIGKKEVMIELDIQCSEAHKYLIIRRNGRLFVINKSDEVTNNGLFYRLQSFEDNQEDRVAFVRAGDIIRVGNCSLRFIVHNWGIFSEIGDRPHQEDKHCIIDDLRIFDDVIIPYYAVYDGHNGGTCSAFLKKNFHNNIRELIKANNLAESKNFFADLCKTIQDAIIYTDLNYYDVESNFSVHHGSTCVALFFIGNKIICCNIGDSISILFSNNKKINLSRDFKPTREKEKGRIMKKNGWVSNDRLLGYISVSRGFGDWSFKDPKKQHELKKIVSKPINFEEYLISNRAEFRIFEIDTKKDEYIILASDGIFQHSNNDQSVFDTINKYLTLKNNEDSEIKNISDVIDNVRLDIINNIYGDTSYKNHSTIDNMTLILIDLQNNKH